MKTKFFALALAMAPALAATALPAPASAQTRQDQYRWDQAQQRFAREQQIYQRERDLYMQSQRGRGYRSGYNQGGYNQGPAYDDRNYATDYDATRYYRDDPRYQERVLTSQDEVYRGSDGRYYCRRSDGTTGLIIGAGAGALLGSAIAGGDSRLLGAVLGAAGGAAVGSSIDRGQITCR